MALSKIQALSLDTGVGGKVLQVVSSKFELNQTNNSTSYASTNYALSLTPSSTSSKIFVKFNGKFYMDGNSQGNDIAGKIKLVRTIGATSDNIMEDDGIPRIGMNHSGYLFGTHQTEYLDSPATTSSVEYRIHIAIKVSGMVISLPSDNGDSSATLMEIAG